MAIHEKVIREGSEGITKQFEMSAMTMLFDNLQKNQYQHPEKSTIRELVSNGIDATNEKLNALKVINGEIKVEDLYLTRNDAMFADSNYLAEYYDKKWLSEDPNKIDIIYQEAIAGAGRDTLRIIDNGVGVGHIVNPNTRQSRLQGILKLGFSTKRNNSAQLGKFGIGAKAALSTGVDSYTMITRHNGKEFRFEVYDYKADPLVPRLNLEVGKDNPFILFEDWEKRETAGVVEWVLASTHKIHYLETTQKNGTEIIVHTKRHHRTTYLNAVQSQLLYFDNITFSIVREDGEIDIIPVQAEILYEDDYIILSNNTQFSKPHFVLNKVNYGYVNWQELELEDKLGNIAYKIKPESVSINPSRESLIWDDKTRKTVMAVQIKVAEIASRVVAEALKETDLILWLRKCSQVLGRASNADTIAGKLAGLVTKADLKLVFEAYPKLIYTYDPKDFFLDVLEMEGVYSIQANIKGVLGHKIERDKLKGWNSIYKPIYLQTDRTSNKKETYLLLKHPEGFIKLKVIDPITLNEREIKLQKEIYDMLLASPEVTEYESVEVPAQYDNVSDEDEAFIEIKSMSPAEQRVLQGKIVCMYPVFNAYAEDRQFTWGKMEPVIFDLMTDTAEVVYGFQEDDELIHLVANLLTKGDRSYTGEFYNEKFKLVRIAKLAAKHYKNHIYIKDFILSINNQTIAMHNKLVNWHTARKIDEVLSRMSFLNNFSIFNSEITRMYINLRDFHRENYRDIKGSSKFGCSEAMLQDLNEYADKVITLQLYIESHKGNTEAIAAQAKALFELEDEQTFTGAVGINMAVYKELETVLEYIEPLEHIFNNISPLYDALAISPELEAEIKEIMKNKGIIN